MHLVTGANGQLGRLVVDRLLAQSPADRIIAAVRDPNAARDLAAKGVIVRQADYDRPDTLASAFRGATRVLLISSNAVGQRRVQHRAVISAARDAGVGLIAYTSLVNLDTSPLVLATEHRDTEAALAGSGVPHVELRNGWYNENRLAGIAAVLRQGVLPGCAGEGRFSSAARANYADAAVATLLGEDHAGKVYELAGDTSWSLPELAAEISRQTGKRIVYEHKGEDAFADLLKREGVSSHRAEIIADSDTGASKGALRNDGGDLRRLIGRPTTPIARSLRVALEHRS